MKRLIPAILVLGAALILNMMFTQITRSEIVTTVGFKPASSLLETEPKDKPFIMVAGGCFWCVESEFRRVEGVLYTVSGYAGSDNPNTTYEQSHTNGSREVVKVYYDADKVSTRELFDFFMTRAHDPTQADGQGPDIGLPYTSAVFYVYEDQKKLIEEMISEYTANKTFKNPITTKVLPVTTYNDAEEYHQRYYEKYEARAGQPHINIWLRQQRENAKNLTGTR